MLTLRGRGVCDVGGMVWVLAFARMTLAKACTATYLRGGVSTLGNAFGSVSG